MRDSLETVIIGQMVRDEGRWMIVPGGWIWETFQKERNNNRGTW